jgi:hypothetical protein
MAKNYGQGGYRRSHKTKKKDYKKAKHVDSLITIVEKKTQKLVEKCANTTFNLAWFVTTMQEVGDRFHWIGLQANPLLYKI